VINGSKIFAGKAQAPHFRLLGVNPSDHWH